MKDQKNIYMYFIKSLSVRKNNTTGLRTASCSLKENKFANSTKTGWLVLKDRTDHEVIYTYPTPLYKKKSRIYLAPSFFIQ